MKEQNNEPQFASGENVDPLFKGLYGQDPEMSLLSVNFAPKENSLLNEHYEVETKE